MADPTTTRSYTATNDSRLLKLPTELRLQIYSYALLAPGGVTCQAVRMHGTSCLYRYTPYRSSVRGITSSHNTGMPDRGETTVKAAKTAPVVSHTNNLNQLKYVCRQVNAETKGMLVAHNNLIFDRGVESLLTFVRTCPHTTLKTVRNVTIVDKLPPASRVPGHSGPYATLIDFSEQYPNTAVQLHHDRLRPDSPKFFLHALRFNVHFRTNIDYVARIETSISAQIEALTLSVMSWGATQLDDIRAYPKNLRAYPPWGMTLEEFLDKLWYDADRFPGGDFDAVILAKEIYEEGI